MTSGTLSQTFNGTGGSVITLTDTSRFNLNVSGLTPSALDFNHGLESVTISINHTRVADIDCFLAAPDGTIIELTTDNGGTSDHYTNTVFRNDAANSITSGSAPFTGTFRPEGELWRVNNGQNGNGIWQLRVIDDNNNGVTGSVISWKLTFGNDPAETFVFNQSALPIVVINTNGQTIKDDPKIICDMGIIYNGPGMRNHLSDPHNDYSGKIGIEIRGSSSQMFPKKSYGFETRSFNTQVDSNVSLLGMPTEHDWILSANYTDKSFCRNVLAYRLAGEMGHYAVRTRYVDVVINGSYKGIYVLMESVKRDKDRVDIKRLYSNETTYPDVSGGYILKIDKTTGSGGDGWNSPFPPVNNSNNQKIYFQYDYPKPDSISIQQKAYIQAYVDSFERSLNGPNYRDSVAGFAQYIGNNSFIDYFFSNEMSKNVDGYRISTYLYKDKEKTLKIGPVWDYDIAWGNANYCGGNSTSGWGYQFSCTNDSYQPPFWWQRMLQDTNYANQVKCRWIGFRNSILGTNYIHDIIDSIATVLDESQEWNFETWPILGTYVWPNPSPYPSTYAGEISNLKNWITARLGWLDSNMPGNCNCSVAVSVQNITCESECDGVAVALGSSPYQKYYQWDSGSTYDSLSNLCPGQYELSFEDAIGCRKTASATIIQPAALTVNVSLTNDTCAGVSCNGTANILVSGGTAPYTYVWNSGQNSANVSALCAGSYNVEVLDSKGCSETIQFTINNPGAPAITLASQLAVTCPGGTDGSLQVNVNGGSAPYTYLWSPSGGTTSLANGLVAGQYELTVTDQRGCQSTQLFTVSEPPAFNVSETTVSPSCFGAANGSASVQVSGGTSPYQYNWSPDGGTASGATGLSAGNYTVNITDATACSFTHIVIISGPSALTASVSSVPASCSGNEDGSASVSVSGGTPPYSFQWSPSGGTSQSANNLAAGNYIIQVTDANQCTLTTSTVIGQMSQMVLSATSSPATCGVADGSAGVSVSGGTAPYSYDWEPGLSTDSTAQNLSAGTYRVTVRDNNNCEEEITVHVSNSNGLLSSLNFKNDVSCYGGSDGSASISVSGGTAPYSYSWMPFGGTGAVASNLSAGIYTVSIEDAAGCLNIQPVTINEPPVISISMIAQPVTCFGGNNGSVQASVAGGTIPYTYNWSTGLSTDSTISGLSAGNYFLEITDAEGCSSSQSVVVDESPPIQLTFSVTDATCGLNNGAASVLLSGGVSPYDVYWPFTGDSTSAATGIPSGSHVVLVSDSLSCFTSDTVYVGSGPKPQLTILVSADVTCNGGNNGSVDLDPGNGTSPYSFTWSPAVSSGSSASGLSAGIYTVWVEDQAGCRDSILVQVNEPAPLGMILFSRNVSCEGMADGEIYADVGGGTPTYSYAWNPGPQSNDTAVNLTPGLYEVLVTDHHGCTATSATQITEPLALNATVVSTGETCGGMCDGTAYVQLSGGTEPYRFLWCDGDTSTFALNLCEGSCVVIVRDGNNCELTDTFRIEGEEPIDVTISHSDATCIGCSDGTATATVSGGIAPYTYLWNPGNHATASIAGLPAGLYELCVTDSESCVKCESVEILDRVIGIEEWAKTDFLYVYPNPFSGQTTFAFVLEKTQQVKLQVYDMKGSLVRSVTEETLPAGEHLMAFRAGELAGGVYFFRLILNERLHTGRLLINRQD